MRRVALHGALSYSRRGTTRLPVCRASAEATPGLLWGSLPGVTPSEGAKKILALLEEGCLRVSAPEPV